MIKTQAKPELIKSTMNEKYGLKLQSSDISNKRKQVLKDFNPDLTDLQNIDQFIKKRNVIDGHNGFQIAYDKTNPNELKVEILYYQNNTMRKMFNDYGEVLIMDATYGLNAKKYACYVVLIVDNNGNSQVVAVALTAHETSVTFNQVLQFFTTFNNASKVQTISTT